MGDSRAFTLDRMRQGFRTSRHWQAFLTEQDHRAACPDCQGEGPAMTLGDGSQQPTARTCQEALNLYYATCAVADRDRREYEAVQRLIRRKRGF